MAKTITDPRFVCDECGFANVCLVRDGAICTNCGVKYERE